jgi:uncharacterized protein YbjT (DUF2867 family)
LLSARRARVYALLRDPARAADWREAGATPVLADLDDRGSLQRIAGLADVILHLAPPPVKAGTTHAPATFWRRWAQPKVYHGGSFT